MESIQKEPSLASYAIIPDEAASHDPAQEDEGASRGVCSDWLGRPIDDDRAKLMGGWKCSSCILGAFAAGSFAYFGIILNLVVYLVGVAGFANAKAANTVANMSGTSLLCSFLGAYVGDAYMGRLRTSFIFQTLNLLSYAFVSIAVLLISKGLAAASSRTFLLVSLYLVAITGGPILPVNVVVGADQLTTVREKERFFRLISVAVCVGQLLSITLVSFIENRGLWVWGFGLSTIAEMVLLAFLAAMLRFFIQYKDSGNPFVRLFQVPVAAWRKRSLSPSSPECNSTSLLQYESQGEVLSNYHQLQHGSTLSFLDKAAVLGPTDADDQHNPWRLCTITQVEELKSLLRVIPAGMSIALVYTTYVQVGTLFEEQASLMNRQVVPGLVIPAASLNIFAILSSILSGIVATTCGATLRRWLWGGRKAKEGDGERSLTSLQFQKAGLLCGIIVMVIAALVELHRRHAAQEGIQLSVWWLVPQTVLAGIAYYLTKVGGTDFCYSEAPVGMRAVSSAVFNVLEGVGSYLSSLLVTVVNAITTQGGKEGWIASDLNEGHLDYFYWCVASCVAVILCVFLVYSHYYTKVASRRMKTRNVES